MSKALGIDLGTTNSVAAIKRLETDILPNAEGDPLTPSVVSYHIEQDCLGRKDICRWQTRCGLDGARPGQHGPVDQAAHGRNFTDRKSRN